MKYEFYLEQVSLLIDVLPVIFTEKIFALKGGTAINFFIRDLPRLSVDIDLVYLPIEDRENSIKNINESIKNIENKLKRFNFNTKILNKNNFLKLEVNNNVASIIIEPNYTIRGSIFTPEKQKLSKKLEEKFNKFLAIPILNFNDLYAGKICASLDRQHPRDLFDIKILLENEGISQDLFNSFIVYLLSHNRPIHEMLNPNLLDIELIYKNEFLGMSDLEITLDELLNTRLNLIKELNNKLTKTNKEFLISFKEGNPNWDIFELKNIEFLPAINWKLHNIRKMDKNKHKIQIEKLKYILKI